MTFEQLGPFIGPILLILVTLSSAILVAFKVVEKRTDRRNGSTQTRIDCKPGYSKICQENKTNITELKVTGKFVAKEIGEINTSIGNIWRKLDGGQ